MTSIAVPKQPSLDFPRLIQAGMGARISGALLANTTSRLGALGVVSSVGLRHIIVDEIRAGNPESIEIGLTFPVARYIDELMQFAPGGKKNSCRAPMDDPNPLKSDLPKRLSTICSFIEVARAKRGHGGVVGINVMWKAALTALPSIYGAMLAGVDALLCGAGVPMELPDIARHIRDNSDLEYSPLQGTGTHVSLKIAQDDTTRILGRFTPPRMIPILSNFAFPKRIMNVWDREYNGAKPSAFVLENHAAGGHNAPPRNKVSFADEDELVSYFAKVRDLGVPVYVAGCGSTRREFLDWIDRGAYGMQVGSRFALCEESGLRMDLKQAVIRQNAAGGADVLTSDRLSSTGYPFKYVSMPETLSDNGVYMARKRICNKGYLMQSHFTTTADGSVKETLICAAMPQEQYVKLGGNPEDTVDRRCLCNALLATAGLGDPNEPAIVTLGLEGSKVQTLLTARQVTEDILTPSYVRLAQRRLCPVIEADSIRPEGLEPPAISSDDRCSDQLSYERVLV